MSNWTHVGVVDQLQIQRSVMTGRGAYEVEHLIDVERLRLTPDGVFGLLDGAWIVDRHHRHHPDATHWHAADVLSFGFTSHYEHMWDLFRQTPSGSAGENVIVVAPEMMTQADLAGGLRVETVGDVIEFSNPEILEPCVEFTRFMTGRGHASAAELKSDRQKLRNGVRGFAVGISEGEPVEISLGAGVSIRAA